MKRILAISTVLLALLTSTSIAFALDGTSILETTGTRGGLVVHLGCGDGKLTASLHDGDQYMIHGLDADSANVDLARANIRKLGLYGKVSIDLFDGQHLPYIDNLVNLLIVEDQGNLSTAEITRVLAPQGKAYTKKNGKWTTTTKPWPVEIDEWTHFLHGPDNNAVSQDDRVGPPRRLQWVGSPPYARHHDKMSSVSAAVSAGGRVFYIMDLAPPVSILIQPDWNLIARDAFNGTILWKRKIAAWHSHLHGLKSGPGHLPRKLVAIGDRVYVTLEKGGPVSVLNAITGETIKTYDETFGTSEILVMDDILLARIDIAEPTPETLKIHRHSEDAPKTVDDNRLVAIDTDTETIVWQKDLSTLRGTPAADDKNVVFVAEGKVICLDIKTGQERWQSGLVPLAEKYPPRFTPTLVLQDDVILFAGGEFAAVGNRSWQVGKDDTLTAISTATGETLWTAPHPLSGYASAEDLMVIDNVVWMPESTSGHAVGEVVGRDIKTGKVVSRFDPNVETYWFHHRCHRGKATKNYLLTSRTGIEVIDLEKETWSVNHWVRGACLYGIMPANGFIYAPQHPCACFLESKLVGFSALAADESTLNLPTSDDVAPQLVKGAAYDLKEETAANTKASEDWPTYRHNMARTGRASTKLPTELSEAWSIDLGGRLSATTIADGQLYVASIDTHTVHALDAENGSRLWDFTVGGRVDSPPTCYKGLVLFGSADGHVYCLRADSGELVWRFRAAAADRRLMSNEQLESVWPVHGSVLVRDDILYFVAGRSMFLDGGLRLYRLDPRTGDLLSETVLNDFDPDSGKMIQDFSRQHNMPVALPDILSCDGKNVYMRSQPFTLEGKRLPLKALPYAGNPERYSIPSTQTKEFEHLFCPTGFLDDTWWHRTYWVYGSRFIGGWAGYPQAGKVTPAGKILAVDDSTVYGYGRLPQFYRWTVPIEHQLFATAKGKPTSTIGKADSTNSWAHPIPFFARAMVLADDKLFVAGPPDLVDEQIASKKATDPGMQQLLREQAASFRGEKGGQLWAVSTTDGTCLSRHKLETIPVFDGMSAATGRLYLSTVDGKIICFSKTTD